MASPDGTVLRFGSNSLAAVRAQRLGQGAQKMFRSPLATHSHFARVTVAGLSLALAGCGDGGNGTTAAGAGGTGGAGGGPAATTTASGDGGAGTTTSGSDGTGAAAQATTATTSTTTSSASTTSTTSSSSGVGGCATCGEAMSDAAAFDKPLCGDASVKLATALAECTCGVDVNDNPPCKSECKAPCDGTGPYAGACDACVQKECAKEYSACKAD